MEGGGVPQPEIYILLKNSNITSNNFSFNHPIFRYYYNTKILLPVSGRRLVYRFGPNAHGWRLRGYAGPNYAYMGGTHENLPQFTYATNFALDSPSRYLGEVDVENPDDEDAADASELEEDASEVG